ncbi:NCS1 family nucleobase:cation symporter-1 [Myxozyma melibiosi]|uniref:NCS1 family nucleobase:cation symporter-1 n=1 Tax=Myxozyma melibiosi TaxID=54550 RepID=A0ABR1F2V7_9ASCO
MAEVDIEKKVNSEELYDEKYASVAAGETVVISEDDSSDDYSGTKEPSTGIIGKLENFARKYKMELIGIDPVPEDQRNDRNVWTPAYFWWAANLVMPPVSIGCLGISTFGLSFWDSALVIIFFNALGCLPVAFYSMFGPIYGLRQMVFSRFWFGYHGVKIFGVLNVIGCVCWTALNTIVAASLLHSVNDGQMPSWAGIMVVALGTLILGMFGYKLVHAYERWSWIFTFVILWILIARLKMSDNFAAGTMPTGPFEAGNVLSYGSVIFGGTNGWATYACDYAVYQKKDASRSKIFWSVFGSLFLSLTFTTLIGAVIMAAAVNYQPWADSYDEGSVGGLVYSILVTNSLHGFGKFCVVFFALSCIGISVVNIYSLAFSMQIISHYFAIIPRFVWSTIGTGVYFGISMGAYYSFNTFMSNFMSIIAYWICIYEGISLAEHFIFRKGDMYGYDVSQINNPKAMPPGFASTFSFCVGVAGAVLGMDQVWYAGPIAVACKGDVGWQFALIFSFVAYVCTRPIERHFFHR